MKKGTNLIIPWNMLASLIAFFLYSEMYMQVIVPKFNFGGMSDNPRGTFFLEFTLIILTAFILPKKINKPSEFYNWLYFILLLIPSSVLSIEQGSDRLHLLLMFFALWILIAFKISFTYVIFNKIHIYRLSNVQFPYYSIFLFVIITLVLLVVSVGGFFNLSFSEVYEYRFIISENMPIALKYMVPLASGTLIGYLSALSLRRKNIIGFILTIISSILFFGFSSHKSMLFNSLVAATGYFLFKMSRPHLLILIGFSSLTIISLILPEDTAPIAISLFSNRIVFLPNHINFFYFKFFSENPFMLWAESKISLGLIDSPLPMTVMNYMGGLLTGNYYTVANTGWVANAYMNAGIIGIFLYAAIIGIIFSLIDFWARMYGRQFVGAAFLIPVSTFILSADLTIVLLTGGLIVLLIIFQISSLLQGQRLYILSAPKAHSPSG